MNWTPSACHRILRTRTRSNPSRAARTTAASTWERQSPAWRSTVMVPAPSPWHSRSCLSATAYSESEAFPAHSPAIRPHVAPVGALLVNRATARFILRTGSAGSKGLPAAGGLRPSLPRRQHCDGSVGARHAVPASPSSIARASPPRSQQVQISYRPRTVFVQLVLPLDLF